MAFRRLAVLIVGLVLAFPAFADDRLVRLHAPEALVETGLMQHILPRFSLKTSVRVEMVPEPEAQIVLGAEGRALFEGAGRIWHMEIRDASHPGTERFAEWLTSEVGRNTVIGFAPDGDALFAPPTAPERAVAEIEYYGDPELGHAVSVAKCTRCHAVDEATRGAGIGSTPSFAVLRSLDDWEGRFAAFYALNPHPAFTQVEDVTLPFPPERPSPIVPVELTLDEVEAILAYVAGMGATDLGPEIDYN